MEQFEYKVRKVRLRLFVLNTTFQEVNFDLDRNCNLIFIIMFKTKKSHCLFFLYFLFLIFFISVGLHDSRK